MPYRAKIATTNPISGGPSVGKAPNPSKNCSKFSPGMTVHNVLPGLRPVPTCDSPRTNAVGDRVVRKATMDGWLSTLNEAFFGLNFLDHYKIGNKRLPMLPLLSWITVWTLLIAH